MPPSPRSARLRRARAVGLLLAVIAVTSGVLGMHALGTHGLVPDGAVPGGHTVAAPSSDEAHEQERGSVQGSQGSHGSHGGHGLDGMAALCLAILVSALGLALLPRRGDRVALRARPRWAASRSAAPARRDTGPPPVWEFSVLRC